MELAQEFQQRIRCAGYYPATGKVTKYGKFQLTACPTDEAGTAVVVVGSDFGVLCQLLVEQVESLAGAR